MALIREGRPKSGRAATLTLDIGGLTPSSKCNGRSPRTPKTSFTDLASPYRHSPLSALSFPSGSSNGRSYCSTSALLKKPAKKTPITYVQDVHQQRVVPVDCSDLHPSARINRAVLSKLVYEEKYALPSLQDTPLVTALQIGAPTAPILWLFHPSSGCADKYNLYVVNGLPCTVYTISNMYLCHGYRFKSISQMCRIYLRYHIRKIQPEGPYYLGGWGMGGVCAREVGALLTSTWQEKQQREIQLSSAPTATPHRRTVTVFLIDAVNPSFQPQCEQAKGQSGHGRLLHPRTSPSSPRSDAFEQHLHFQQHISARLLQRHVPTPFRFGAPAALLAAKDSSMAPITVHVHLLKAGLLESPHQSARPKAWSSLTAIHACLSNGWVDASVAPGLADNTQVVPTTHEQLLGSTLGVSALNQWLASKFQQ